MKGEVAARGGMPPCVACGRPVEPGAPFCTACGASVAPAPTATPPGAECGRTQEPWLVPLLALVTLGVYMYVWAWRVGREVDAARGTAYAYPAAKRSVYYGLAGSLLFVGGLVGLLVVTGGALIKDDGSVSAEALAGAPASTAAFASGAFLIGFVVLLVGAAWFYIALWRVWRAVEEAETRRGVPPLSPALLLVLVLVPYVNLVGSLYMLWRTQKGLNGMWDATPPPVAPQKWRG